MSDERQEGVDLVVERFERLACRQCGKKLQVGNIAPFSIIECPECHTRQPVPALLGNFMLIESLGSGGMGTVYRAVDQALGRPVAVKVMRRSLSSDPQFVENFLREARTAAALNHRHVVQVYSCGTEKEQPYIVMELVDGGHLDAMIAAGQPIDEERALQIGIEIAEGLKAAQESGLIHGDIKPANILFDREGAAKVADFGLARFLKWRQEPGEIWGTPFYIAPEKAKGQKVDHRADIYSLGATLYQVLSGRPPFDGESITDVVVARFTAPPRPLNEERADLHPRTVEVIMRMLEPDPFMRYPSYSSLLADLRAAQAEVRRAEPAAGTKPKRRSKAAWLIAIIVVVVAALAGLLWLLVRPKEEPSPPTTEVSTPETGANADSQADAQQAAAQAEEERYRQLLQPFNQQQTKMLSNAARRLNEGSALGAEQVLQKQQERLPVDGTGHLWLSVVQALIALSDGRSSDAAGYLHPVLEWTSEDEEGKPPHPGRMPHTIARYLNGDISDDDLADTLETWPAWFGDIALLARGVRAFESGDFPEAAERLNAYAERSSEEAPWVYSWQPAARHWAERIATWLALENDASSKIASGQAKDALEQLLRFRADAPAPLRPLADPLIAAARDVEKKAADAQAAAEAKAAREAHEQALQRDLDQLDEARGSAAAFVKRRNFAHAAKAMQDTMAAMQTPEGRRAAELAREGYERMGRMFQFVIRQPAITPYRAGPGSKAGGDVVGADANGITVARGQYGTMQQTWDQVGLNFFVQMANTYLSSSRRTESERADLYLGLALYCLENGGLPIAQGFAQKAIQLQDSLRPTVRSLMPDLLSD